MTLPPIHPERGKQAFGFLRRSCGCFTLLVVLVAGCDERQTPRPPQSRLEDRVQVAVRGHTGDEEARASVTVTNRALVPIPLEVLSGNADSALASNALEYPSFELLYRGHGPEVVQPGETITRDITYGSKTAIVIVSGKSSYPVAFNLVTANGKLVLTPSDIVDRALPAYVQHLADEKARRSPSWLKSVGDFLLQIAGILVVTYFLFMVIWGAVWRLRGKNGIRRGPLLLFAAMLWIVNVALVLMNGSRLTLPFTLVATILIVRSAMRLNPTPDKAIARETTTNG